MRKIIVLDAKRLTVPSTGIDAAQPAEEKIAIRCIFWLSVPAGTEAPITDTQATPTRFSAATQAERDALLSGMIVEEEHGQQFPNDSTPAQIRQALVAAYEARVAALATPVRTTLRLFIGASYDGTWTLSS